MKKDYIPVSEHESDLSETAFIEVFWTGKWEKRVLSSKLAERIEKREEYRLMLPYLDKLPAGSRLLDGGCGLGEWTLYLSQKGYQVTGLDLSQATILKLKEKFPQYSFLAGDIRKTGFPDGSLEAYFSWGTFEHFEDGLGKPLQEARRILKKDGYLFLSVPFQNTRHLRRELGPLWKWDENYQRESGYKTNLRFYQWRLTQPEFRRELEINGFSALQVTPIHKRVGVRRMVQSDLHLDPKSKIGKAAQILLYSVFPKSFAAHMLFATGMKK